MWALDSCHRLCACQSLCGDVDEPEDGPPPWPVCKGLPRPPRPPLVEFFVIHRDDLRTMDHDDA